MIQTDCLLLDAKQAILDEQHLRFESYLQEGRWPEAFRQLQITMLCAADLLQQSIQLLEHILKQHAQSFEPPPPSDSPSKLP